MSRRGKREAESKKKSMSIKKFIFIIIELILVSVMIYSGSKIVIWFLENGKTEQIMEEISEYVQVEQNEEKPEEEKYNINFEELKSKNSDTVAWIKVKGTEVEYPVVQTTDNSYYLTYSFDKTYNKAGWPFVDYRNKLDGTDKNIIVYGHNRRDGSMFENLKNTLTDDWYNVEDNRKIVFITEKEKALYQVFATYKIQEEDYYMQTQFQDFEGFVNTIKGRSTRDFNVEVGKDDQILTLSTCDDNSNYRIVIHAKKILK